MNKPLRGEALGAPSSTATAAQAGPAYLVLAGISVSHFLNDLMQSLIPAIYPVLKSVYHLDFAQIGLITLVNQVTASLLQPVVGTATDRRPLPYSLAFGMAFTLCGIVALSQAQAYGLILVAVALVGVGSSIFHPESSRVARLASGGRPGFAQAVFQVGGNFGSATGPLLAALIVVPYGQGSIGLFSLAAITAIIVLWNVGRWYKPRIVTAAARPARRAAQGDDGLSRRQVAIGIGVLVLLVLSKQVYLASLSSYYTFYLIHKFGVTTQSAQLLLFLFLGSVAAGTLIGGPIGDRIGRKYVIWFSILGVLPFTLALPHADLMWTAILTVVIGLIIASAMPAIIVFGQELVPRKVGMISGFFFGFAFGMGGLGAAALGQLADIKGIEFVYGVCALLPALGLFAVFLPDPHRLRAAV
ncbi:MAG: MFS transporter [Xanthobacteraceae bacterium]|nr:MAG: MFS transporter [Xanthobacteraceae bacterium]